MKLHERDGQHGGNKRRVWMSDKDIYDKAPDWTDQTFYVRACNCLMMLNLLDIITNQEHLDLYKRMDNWFNREAIM